MTKTDLRKAQLLEMLQVRAELRIDPIAQSLNVSAATVRRLIANLESEGLVLRVHGGVRLAPQAGHDYSYRASIQHRTREKSVIGRRAAELVHSGDVVFLDSGTTVLHLAEELIVRIQSGALDDIVVITNSLTHVEGLARWCKAVLIGGEVRSERRDVCGSIAEKTLALFHMNKAFLGADAVHPRKGLMATDERTAKINEIVIAESDETYVLVDSEKFGRASFISYAHLPDVKALVTDSGVDERTRRSILDRAVWLEICNVTGDNAGAE